MLYEPSAAARVRRVSPVAVFRTVICAFGGALPRNAASTACVQAARGEQASTIKRAAASHPNPFLTRTNIVPLVSWSSSTNPARQCPQEAFPGPRANGALRMPPPDRPGAAGSVLHPSVASMVARASAGRASSGRTSLAVHPPAIALPLLRVEYLSHVAHHCEACYTGARIYGGCAGEFQ